jgi:hypothetical protein
MDLTALKADGPNLSAGQQSAFYYARKRRRERERANASEFKSQDTMGVVVHVVLIAQ